MSVPLRVLIVEDAGDDAELIVRALGAGGYDPAYERVDTPQAMEQALDRESWDVIIADYSMPRFSGLAALNLLHGKGLDRPFIVVSGTIGEDVAVEAMKAGAHDYVMKGNLARLAPAVERELREADVRRQRRREEQKFRGLLESAPDAMVIVNEKGEIVLLNRQTERLFRYAREELVGNAVEILIPERFPGKQPWYRSAHLRDPRPRSIGTGLEVRGLRKDRTEFPVEVSVSPLEVDEGTLVSAAIRDISERVRAEHDLREALRRAEESDRLKSAFLANMSHEIRTPLNVILGYTSLIAERLAESGDEDLPSLFDGIDHASKRLMNTIHAIVDLSGIESGTFQLTPRTLKIRAMIEQEVGNVRPLAERRGLRVSCKVEEAEAVVFFDPYCLSRALAHLLDNAIKFTEKGGICVKLFRDSERCLCLEVCDTGVGIDEAHIARLFAPFSQEESGSTRRFEGLGVGLALARRYLELNGAGISVESERGKGSVFTIRFPKSSERDEIEKRYPGGPGLRPPAAHPTRRGRPLILVVEDDRESQIYMKALLKPYYEVLGASSPRKARRHLEAHPGEIRVVLMDLSLKGPEDGISLTRWLRAQEAWKKVPIIATTAHVLPEDRSRAFDAGCDEFLAKPFEPGALLSLIERLIGRASAEIVSL